MATIIFYLIAQMIGAGALVTLLLEGSGINFKMAVTGVGLLMIVYVVFGGMLATTWVQIVKAILLLACTAALTLFVLFHFHLHIGQFFAAGSHVAYHQGAQSIVSDFLKPGLRYNRPFGAIDLISLSFTFMFGTAGLPHILVKFYTVPDAITARKSVAWSMSMMGFYYVMTSIIGLGAAILVGPDYIARHGGTNMSGPLLAQFLGGNILLAIVSAVAFATILAVVAGLTIGASTSFAHDFWINVVHGGTERKPGEAVRVARVAALAVGIFSIIIAIAMGPASNAVVLASMGMVVAASANFPVIVLSIFWRRFNTAGAVAGMAAGLLSSVALILVCPTMMGIDAPNAAAGVARHLIQGNPLFPLENPGIISVPLGFLAAYIGTILSKEPSAEAKFSELTVRANTGIGAEKASAH
jgi:cation/acetate symporter